VEARLLDQISGTPPHCGIDPNQFGVQYHRDHVRCLMHSLDWSPQKAERRALERDENSIARWRRTERLAADEKSPTRLAVHLVFANESGVLLIPCVGQDLVPTRPYSDLLSSPPPARQDLSHFHNLP
jgi:hypothetical protein